MATTSTQAEEVPQSTHSFSVKGKRAIVTGAGSGINLAFASLLLSKGCSVLFADLALRSEAQKVVDQYAKSEPRAVFQKTDVRVWRELEHMFDVADKEFGGVDIVCPGAGIFEPHWSNFWHPPGSKESKDAPDSDRYATMDINVTHPIRTTQLAIYRFLNPIDSGDKVNPTNPKRVIITSSIAGQTSNLLTPLYVAGKHAMNGFIRCFADLDARIGLRVNGVAPGIIKTPLWTEHPEKLSFLDEDKDAWVMPEQVAEAMVRCLEEADLGGGTILEIGAKATRKVAQLNDPGPSGAGFTATNIADEYAKVYSWLGAEAWSAAK
ncbi:NAD(P)-binding protein [Sporormia fimetaria CBS 119925]|uniref:NAD(P)-binding protein n=1 Tax=Sporormia fimetaria CBS 119925 TaxID=1340428 RepID=A0A6A6VBX4_9PLEO|nr:NAD(P)-binding protein [Sporormia fimetaria CBS 119925]